MSKTCGDCIYCSGPYRSSASGTFHICRENSNFNKIVPEVDWCSRFTPPYNDLEIFDLDKDNG